jgi:site-specific recombinase XerD
MSAGNDPKRVVIEPLSPGLEAAAVGWLVWCRDYRGRSPETVRSYTQTMDDLVVWLGGVDVSAVTSADVEAFIHRPRKRVAVAAPATINRDLAAIRSFFQWAVAHGLVDRSPAEVVHGPAQRKRQPRPIPDDVWVAWWQSDLPPSLRTALGLGFYGGLRRAEIVGLHRDQIRDRRIVNFVRKGGGEHSLPLDDMVDVLATKLPRVAVDVHLFWLALEDCRRLVRGSLVGWTCVDPQEVNRRLNTYARSRKLPRFTPHQLRHSAASNLVRTGMPLHLVSALMNHSNIGITMGYVASGGEQLAEWKRGLT